MKISRLISSDKHAAAALMAASDPWLKLGLGPAHCLKSLNVPFRETYVTKAAGKISGLVTITMYGTFKGYIQSLFVAEGFRGEGLGGKLLAFAEKKVLARSPNVFLCVSSFNTGALRFYRRLGYKKAGLLKDFVRKGSDEILLRKTTGPLL
ncbi:MAG: GNAT family N-acetyltransferase [Elusimicrobia bacterium]|nr:GNAT family N-acetyltransferase [Elusimicrobiota bacterium]